MLIQLYLLTTNFFSKVTVPIYTSCGLWLLTVNSYSLETNLWEFFWPGANAPKFQRGIYDCFCQLPRDTINSRLFEKEWRFWAFILRRHRQIRLQTGIDTRESLWFQMLRGDFSSLPSGDKLRQASFPYTLLCGGFISCPTFYWESHPLGLCLVCVGMEKVVVGGAVHSGQV